MLHIGYKPARGCAVSRRKRELVGDLRLGQRPSRLRRKTRHRGAHRVGSMFTSGWRSTTWSGCGPDLAGWRPDDARASRQSPLGAATLKRADNPACFNSPSEVGSMVCPEISAPISLGDLGLHHVC
jgi:hypothetical protein